MFEFEEKENVTEDLIHLIVKIGIDQKYPVLLGKTVKYMMMNGYTIPVDTFK